MCKSKCQHFCGFLWRLSFTGAENDIDKECGPQIWFDFFPRQRLDLVLDMSRRRPWVFIFVVFGTFALLLWTVLNGYHHRLEPFKEPLHESLPPSKGAFNGSWNFSRDAGNLLMTDAHCDAAFPDLFKDIDRAVKSREYHHITEGELDITPHIPGYIRGLVYDQQVRHSHRLPTYEMYG